MEPPKITASLSHGIEAIQPKEHTLAQLASQYHLSPLELVGKLSEFSNQIGATNKGVYSQAQVSTIYQLLGNPFILKLCPPIKVRVLPGVIEKLINASWQFGCAMLWGGQKFSDAEIKLSKSLIREYYEKIPADVFAHSAGSLFIQYLERMLLAKEYSSRAKDKTISHPCIWLNKGFEKGFASTKAKYQNTLNRRKIKPDFRSGIRQKAELYAAHILNPSPEVFWKAAKAFSFRDSNLLLLFCSTVSPNQHSED